MFFHGISLVLLIGSGTAASSFYLDFFDSVNLEETVVHCGLKGLFFMWVSLCSLCLCNIFGERAVFSMDACHSFPHCVLPIILLIMGETGIVVITACLEC